MKRNLQVLAVVVFCVMFVPALVLGLMVAAPPPPAQALSVTPVANLVYSPDRNFMQVYNETTIAADTYSPILDISAQEWCDFQYVVDQEIDSADVNTTTVTIQFSNDDSNWVNGPALVSANAADAGDMTRLPVFGRYMRFYMNVTNTATPTWVLNAFCK
jgi:hypothetical protein